MDWKQKCSDERATEKKLRYTFVETFDSYPSEHLQSEIISDGQLTAKQLRTTHLADRELADAALKANTDLPNNSNRQQMLNIF